MTDRQAVAAEDDDEAVLRRERTVGLDAGIVGPKNSEPELSRRVKGRGGYEGLGKWALLAVPVRRRRGSGEPASDEEEELDAVLP